MIHAFAFLQTPVIASVNTTLRKQAPADTGHPVCTHLLTVKVSTSRLKFSHRSSQAEPPCPTVHAARFPTSRAC